MLSALLLASVFAEPPNLGHKSSIGGPDTASLISPSLNRGTWSDRIAVDLPPAPSGVVPEIALVADPGVREGHLGSGWSLEIGGQISRHQGYVVPALGSTLGDG